MFVENETFEKLIKLLSDKNYNAEKMVLSLAKTHPELFVHLAEESKTPVPEWHKGLIKHIEENQYVSAIKLFREQTGHGLKESKDLIDNLKNYMHYNYNAADKPDSLNPVHPSLDEIFEKLRHTANEMFS